MKYEIEETPSDGVQITFKFPNREDIHVSISEEQYNVNSDQGMTFGGDPYKNVHIMTEIIAVLFFGHGSP